MVPGRWGWFVCNSLSLIDRTDMFRFEFTSLEIVSAKSSTLFFSMFYLVRFPHCQGVLVVAVCVAAFFYHRRGRLMEDERQLRGEVELNTSVNRF